MSSQTVVRDILEAIESVRGRLKQAYENNDHINIAKLMGDLNALYMCLSGEAERFMDEQDAIDAIKKAS